MMGAIEEYIKKRLTASAPDFEKYRRKVSPTPMLGDINGSTDLPTAPSFTEQQYRGQVIPTPPSEGGVPKFAPTADQESWKAMPANPVAQRINEGMSPYEALLADYYKESEADLQRRKKASMLSDIAQLFGQTANLGIGARQFNPIKSNTAEHIAALDKLKDAYNKYGLDYRLQQVLNEEGAKRAGEAADAKLKRDLYLKEVQHRYNMGEIDAKTKGKLQETLLKANNERDIKAFENSERWKRTVYAQKSANQRAALRSANGGGKVSDLRTIQVRDKEGNYETLSYTKDKEGAIASLFEIMRKRVNSDEKLAELVNDYKLQYNLGSDVPSQMMTTIAKNMQYFPDLIPYLKNIIGDTPQGNAVQKGAASQAGDDPKTPVNEWEENDEYETYGGNAKKTSTDEVIDWKEYQKQNAGKPAAAAPQGAEKPSNAPTITNGEDKYAAYADDIVKTKAAKEKADKEAEAARVAESQNDAQETYRKAKERLEEINEQLKMAVPKDSIERIIKERGLSTMQAASLRRKYSNDVKDQAKLKREKERLERIINNTKLNRHASI